MKPEINIALTGNPNSGKSTLFNALTGARQHVGNYPGITVEKKEGRLELDGARLNIVDLPGTYSLTAYSLEERVARGYLADAQPDVVIDVLNAGVLERNLYLAVQILELGSPLILALNMMDEAEKHGFTVDAAKLSKLLGLPVYKLVAKTGHGVRDLARSALEYSSREPKKRAPLNISYGPDLDPVLLEMQKLIEAEKFLTSRYPSRWVALKYLEADEEILELGRATSQLSAKLEKLASEAGAHLRDTLETHPEAVIADYRYGFISSLLRQGVLKRDNRQDRVEFSDKLDTLLTHRLLGPVIMLGVMYLVYLLAFSLGKYPMDWLQAGFDWLGKSLEAGLDEGLLRSLLVDGIIAGVGGVMGFVPLIMIIFVLIAFLEDSGYMARIAYMLDRMFRIFGLHGCSVMPFIISGGIAGGCAVPGVLATRTLRSPKERLATILTLPLMTCGAKMPVFIMLTAAFLPKYQAQAMFGLTLLGWVMALAVAWLLRSSLVRGESTPFVMELPPYRLPTWNGLLIHTWERTWQYVKKAGTFILAVSILIWSAMTFPGLPKDRAELFETQKSAISAQIESLNSRAAINLEAQDDEPDSAFSASPPAQPGPENLELLKAKLEDLDKEQASQALTASLAGQLGTSLEPLTKWAGFDWRTNIALVGGFAAKEVIISTLGTAYSLGKLEKEETTPLVERLASDSGWSVASGIALMVFILLYSPCFPTLVIMAKETGTWKWPVFSMIFNTALGFVMATAIYQIGLKLL